MGFFNRYPYTDFHRLNADWILDKLKEMMGITQEAAETVETYDDRLTAVEAAADGAVRFDERQDLTQSQQRQGRDNIGAASAGGLTTLSDVVWGIESTVERCVRTDIQQSFNSTEQAMARENIGAAAQVDLNNLDQALDSCVQVVDQTNAFTAAERTQARRNIGAASSTVVDDLDQAVAGLAEDLNNAVLYTSQQLTSAQQAQARTNIGAASNGAAAGIVRYDTTQSLYTSEKLQARLNIGAAPASGSSEYLPAIDPVANTSLGILDDAAAGNDGDEITITTPSTLGQSIIKLEGDQSTFVRISGVAAPDQDDDVVNKGYADDHYDPLWHMELIAGTSPTIALGDYDDRPILTCGECSSITVTGNLLPEFELVFDSGSTPTTLALPASINMPADFQVNANTHYEINVRNTWGLYAAWEVTT